MNKDINKMLVVRLGSIGEVLMTTPALRAIKETLPKVRITILTLPNSKEISRLIPEIDDVIVFNNLRQDYFKIIEKIKNKKFDTSIVFNSCSESPFPQFLLCFLAKIPIRAGFSKEDPANLLTHWTQDEEPINLIRHDVRRQLDLAGALGFRTNNEKLSLKIIEKARKRIEKYLKEKGIGAKNCLIALDPNTLEGEKYLIEVLTDVSKKIREFGHQIVATQALKKVQQVKLFELEKKNVEDLCSLVLLSSFVISNDKNIIQIASALNIPIIALNFGHNFQTPWMVKNEVLLYEDFENLKSKNIFFQDYSFCGFPKLSYAQILKSIRKILNIKEKRIVVRRFNEKIVQPVLFGV